MTKLKFKIGIFKSFNTSNFLLFFFENTFLIIFWYIQKLSGKYYEETKEWLQKKARERKESEDMVVSITKIYQKMKKINWLGIEKNILEWEKHFIIIIKNILVWKKSIRNFQFSGFANYPMKYKEVPFPEI